MDLLIIASITLLVIFAVFLFYKFWKIWWHKWEAPLPTWKLLIALGLCTWGVFTFGIVGLLAGVILSIILLNWEKYF